MIINFLNNLFITRLIATHGISKSVLQFLGNREHFFLQNEVKFMIMKYHIAFNMGITPDGGTIYLNVNLHVVYFSKLIKICGK